MSNIHARFIIMCFIVALVSVASWRSNVLATRRRGEPACKFNSWTRTRLASTVEKRQQIETQSDILGVPIDYLPQIVPLSDDNFADEVLKTDGALSVVLFEAPWCGPCVNQRQALSVAVGKYGALGSCSFYSVDTDCNVDAPAEYSIRSIPSTVLFKNGVVVSEIIGAVSPNVVMKQIAKYIDE
jgi:thioredoxin 1